LIEVLALQAQLANINGDEVSALKLLEQAVELAQPGGFIRLFIDLGSPIVKLLQQLHNQGVALDYIGRILDAASKDHACVPTISQSALVEPLTDRELEILSLLAQRLTNKEVAAQLFISPGTVRQHTHNIYQKLDVKGRRQAVAVAGKLGILQTE
jgi:LuxR family maltose regulon positive regulatory protein